MANRERGEVSLKVGRKRYTLRPTLTAYCELEDRMDKTHVEVMAEAARGSARSMRALLWSYLQAVHATEFETFESAGVLIDTVGMDVVGEQLKKLDEANQPPETGKAADPQTAQGGPGNGSIGPHAVPA